jgi:ribosomal protein L25 (general stress protein Ctc)
LKVKILLDDGIVARKECAGSGGKRVSRERPQGFPRVIFGEKCEPSSVSSTRNDFENPLGSPYGQNSSFSIKPSGRLTGRDCCGENPNTGIASL